MALYIALLRKEKHSDFGVDFPDFPGCITAGESLQEVHRRAPEALKFHIMGMLEDGDQLPEPGSFEDIMADPANEGAIPFLVNVPDIKSTRISITVPEPDLELIDAYARQHSLSRSAFLVDVAKQAMRGGEADPARSQERRTSVPRP